METNVHPGFRVIRGPDWSYKNQDGGKGHAGTILGQHHVCRPNFPKHSVLVQWDNGNKGLYRVGNDQAFDLRIIDTANAVSHPKIWCDGCDADEIKGMRWRCTECYAIDLCTTCYMNDEHDLTHVFMRVLSSHKTSMGPKMLPRSSSPRIALKGSFPGGKVVRYPHWYKKFGSDTQVGTVVKNGQTAKDRVKLQAVVVFICTPERVDFTKISSTLSGSGGHVYEGHLPNLGDPEPVSEGDKVFVTATPAELEKLQKRRGLWKPDMAKTFRRKGLVNKRTNSGDFKVTFNDTQETFTMNSTALRKLHPLSLGQLVRISDDIEMVKRLQFGHGGWTAAMKKELGKVGKVVKIDGLDVHVKIKRDHKFIFNSANLTPERIRFPCPAEEAILLEEILQHAKRRLKDHELSMVVAVFAGDIQAVENILLAHPDWVNYEIKPDFTLLHVAACQGDVNMVKLLVEKGAFIDSCGGNCSAPLIVATTTNNFEAVKYLLDKGADLHAINRQGFTSLTSACKMGFSESAHYLLMHGADINQKGAEGLTPVLLSMDSGDKTILDLVIDRKEADLKTVSNSLVLSAMHGAARVDNTYALTKLLDKVPRLVEARDIDGQTPIFIAARTGSLKAAELLIKKARCNVNALEDKRSLCPLAEALANMQLHMVDILVRNGADPNLNNHGGNTPLHVALNVINTISRTPGQYMKEEPYMAEMKKKWGHLGIKTNTDALLAYLVYHGGDLNARNRLGITIREQIKMTKGHILPALVEIQTQKRKDITRQQSSANRPLRNPTKNSNTTESDGNPVPSLLKKSTTGTGSKMQNTEKTLEQLPTTSGGQRKSSRKKSKKRRGKAAGDSRAHGALKNTTDKEELEQLQAQLQQKDEKLETLRSRVQTLEHLVKKKISFSCGHDVIRSIAELIPECPNCSEPITSVVDLQ